MGNIHLRTSEYSDALNDFRKSVPFLLSMQDYSTLSECYLGLAEAFSNLKMPDSALYYAGRSYSISSENQFLLQSLHASQFLTKLYKNSGNIDSAFAYQEVFIALKDSFDNSEKIKELQVLTMNEQFRQDEITREKQRESKQRLFKLEFLLIGMLIPVFFFMSAYISRKKVHKRIIELSGIFSLIFLFEYITLLIHPLVKEKANHSPVYEILLFVAIAAILSPTHHKVEYWLISKLTRRHHHKEMPLHS
jgi:tetratricopeptide (TPR) repeat protein